MRVASSKQGGKGEGRRHLIEKGQYAI